MEDLFGYYGITSFSFRRAMHRILANDASLYTKVWSKVDITHPSCIGHRSASFSLYL